MKLYPGPWHCKVCLRVHKIRGTRDITLDKLLIRYLAVGEKPHTHAQLTRVLRAAEYVKITEDDRMWMIDNKGHSR